ncbi:MAG: hypothetical protein ACRCXK_11170 [Wohlfahrtiimonas sp.]
MKNYKIISFTLCLHIFISLNPIYVWGNYKLLYVASLVLLFFVSLGELKISTYQNLSLPKVALIVLIIIYNYLLGMSTFGIAAYSLSVILILLLPIEILLKTIDSFRNLFCILIFPGIILWLIHHITGDFSLFSLFQIPDHLNPSVFKVMKNENYMLYPFSVALSYMYEQDSFYRFIGFFDEPGLLGTVAFFLLATTNYNIKNIKNIIILIAGLISLSLAFYVLTFIYLLFCSFRQYQKIIYLIIFSVSIYALSNLSIPFNKAIGSRLHIVHSDAGIVVSGDNRSNNVLEQEFIQAYKAPIAQIIFGDRDYKNTDGSASWKMIFIQTGIVGLLICTSILLLTLVIYSEDKKIYWISIVFLICLFASFYQRPDIIKAYYILAFIVSIVTSPLYFMNKKT